MSDIKAFAPEQSSPIEKKDYPRVDDLLEQRFGAEDTVRQMRDDLIPGADADDVYVWQRADQYILIALLLIESVR